MPVSKSLTAQPPRAVLYARVSTMDRQHPEVQIDQLRAVAAQRGWIVVGAIIDRVSGTKEARPGLDQARALAARAGANLLAATALDRVARSLRHALNLHAELEGFGCTMVLLRENVDTSTPMGRFAFQVMGAAAELERALICERVRAGLEHARARGRGGGRRRSLDYDRLPEARKMRARLASWTEIAWRCGGSPGAWSRALSRAA
jgi:DNA invertase Pin-like site-specific DNA recombinase